MCVVLKSRCLYQFSTLCCVKRQKLRWHHRTGSPQICQASGKVTTGSHQTALTTMDQDVRSGIFFVRAKRTSLFKSEGELNEGSPLLDRSSHVTWYIRSEARPPCSPVRLDLTCPTYLPWQRRRTLCTPSLRLIKYALHSLILLCYMQTWQKLACVQVGGHRCRHQ